MIKLANKTMEKFEKKSQKKCLNFGVNGGAEKDAPKKTFKNWSELEQKRNVLQKKRLKFGANEKNERINSNSEAQ